MRKDHQGSRSVRQWNFGVHRFFYVARESGVLVGTVLLGLERTGLPAVTVFVLGVKLTEHRRGIGTILKAVAMWATSVTDEWPNRVSSTVHRNNYRMQGVNAKFGVTSVPYEMDGGIPPHRRGGQTSSAAAIGGE